jgi:hypothetical protein
MGVDDRMALGYVLEDINAKKASTELEDESNSRPYRVLKPSGLVPGEFRV